MKNKDNLNRIISCLPFSVRSLIQFLPENLTEIRLRSARPIVFCAGVSCFFLNFDGSFTAFCGENCVKTSPKELYECFNTICNYSVYSKQNEINNGFITLKGGNRAGICGTAVRDKNGIVNIKDITSLNIRVAGERLGCSENVINAVGCPERGFLLCGAPCSGKTTILRDISRKLSFEYKVCVIDCRSEIAAVYGGVVQNDVGLCDVLDSYTKRDGFDHALRCMSPDIIICDEIGDKDDAEAVYAAALSGAAVIAAAHCRDKSELVKNPRFQNILKNRLFEKYVFLDKRQNIGKITGVYAADELF